MSLGTFLLGVWRGIKSLFNKLPDYAKTAVETGVKVVDFLKEWDAKVPGIAAAIEKQFPGLPDLSSKLAEISAGLKLVQISTTPEDALNKLVTLIKELDPKYKGDILNSLAGQVAIVSADGKITSDETLYLIKWYYDHIHTADDGED